MNSLLEDARFSWRLMRKRPGATLLAMTTLVLGIGLNAAVFSVLNAVVLRPLPVADPGRIVNLYAKANRTGATLGISYPEYLDWKSQARSFQEIAVIYGLSFTLTGYGPPEHLKAEGISASGLRTWGVSTVLGRGFTDDDDRPGSDRVVILNHAFWLRKFGGDIAVLGKALVLDEQQYIIVGVLQPTQVGVLKYPDVWVANGPQLSQRMMRRDMRFFFPFARLKSNVSQSQAQAEIETIANSLAVQYPDTNKDMGVVCVSASELLTADGRKPLLLLIVASTLIFFLAAVNVMTVFMGYTIERGQELSVRLAVGASRWSLLRQLFIQAVMFAFAGGGVGLLLAKLSLVLLLRGFPNALLRFQETTVDERGVAVTIGMALLASLIATVLPAFYAVKLNPARELAGERSWFVRAKHRAWGQGALILFEVALASGLSVVSGLLIKSFYEVERVDLGFNPSHVFSFQLNPPPTRYKEPEQQIALYKAAAGKLAALPGLQLTSAISNLPLTNQGYADALEVEPQSPVFGQQLFVEDESILPGFFQALRVPLLRGRDFSDADRAGAPPVVILDDLLAAKLWPNQSPLGKRVRITDARNGPPLWREVVGMVREVKHFGPERRVRWMQLYKPLYQDPTPTLSFVINSGLPEAAVKSAAEKAIQEVDKNLPVENFETMDDYLDTLVSGRKLTLLLLSAFAGIGIGLGAIGIYGAVANAVIQQRRDIAIRLAMGATHSRVLALVTRFSLMATLGGIATGSLLLVSVRRLLGSLLFGVSALDPSIYVLSAGALLLLGLIACAIPAWRLFRFDIQAILRR